MVLFYNKVKTFQAPVIPVYHVVSDFSLQKQPPKVFCKKGVLRNFEKFPGKHLCQSLFFNKSIY